jgi:hypothetical protein
MIVLYGMLRGTAAMAASSIAETIAILIIASTGAAALRLPSLILARPSRFARVAISYGWTVTEIIPELLNPVWILSKQNVSATI